MPTAAKTNSQRRKQINQNGSLVLSFLSKRWLSPCYRCTLLGFASFLFRTRLLNDTIQRIDFKRINFLPPHILVPNLGKELKMQINTFSFSASVNYVIDSSASITCLPPCILPGNIGCSEKDLHSFRFNLV
ncbi:hypothetical protein CDAR_266321 [Caerostris darwini]|uniref:Uncharacterized protein n=1 Tax=Caerostris darwini TaxID=1538125 RepID=A0AAV4W0U1_9ARAC|nr:hypothetical protein CDAR_266321 [Caerostris darwini]